jgi:predicted amidohydrolase
MKIAFVQMNCLFGEVAANLAKAEDLLESAEADLFVLPELFNTGYLFQSADELEELAETGHGKTVSILAEIAARKNCVIVAGFAERAEAFYNSCALVGPNGHRATYRKIHLFDTEKRWFAPGNTPFFVVDIGIAKIGMMICFDWMFPESMRSLALLGADVICHPSNLVMPYCQKAMQTRCLENNVFAITANRIGSDVRDFAHIEFTGQSQITGPRGDILAAATRTEECVQIVEIDINAARNKQLNPQNNLVSDRRPEMYSL